MNARIIVADDHPMVCQGLCEIIERTSGLEVIAKAYDGEEAERLARSLPADLLIADIAMPVRSGIKLLQALRGDGLALPVLFFSMYPANQYVAYARRAGAQGFIGKEAGEAALLAAIRRILAGGTSFPSLSARADAEGLPRNALFDLSLRESEVLQRLLRGMPLVRIAGELGVSAQSVTTYRRRVLDKLGVRNNAELIRLMTRPE